MDLYVFIIKQILNISQTTGFRDHECGYSLSPLVFLGQGAREIMAKEDLPFLLPVPCGAMTVIGVSTLPQER